MLTGTRSVVNILMFVVAGIVAVFSFEFILMMLNYIGVANGTGFLGMFDSYTYVSIEVTFLCLMLVGAYQVFRVGLRGRGDDEWDFIESD